MDQSARILLQVEILFLYVLALNCQQHTFFIKPANSLSCPKEINTSQCYDLHTFISEKYKLSVPNTTLLFLPGEHFLELDLSVRNTKEFLMLPYIQSNDSTARMSIICTNGQSIYLQNISFVKVDSMSFHSCGVNGDSSGALQLRSVYHSEITNSKWYDSRSSAIFIQDSNTVISDCLFMRGNCSNYIYSGGGIHVENSNVIFTGSIAFKENDAEKGGGLSLLRSNILLDGKLMVVGNSASDGGGVYLEDCTLIAKKTSLLTVEHNSAGLGGGMYFESLKASISGTVVVTSNSAHDSGGGSWFRNSHCYFTGYTSYINNSQCDDDGNGGGLYLSTGYLVIKDANFVQNSASSGGAISSEGAKLILLGKVNFTNNIAKYCGGGIFISRCSLSFSGYVNFIANTASEGGALYTMYLSECIFKNTAVFSGNRAKNYGGSFWFSSRSSITFLSVVKVSASTAGKAGGGFIVRDESSLVMSSEVFIENSHAHFYGGAIALNFGVLRMEKSSEFINNSAEYGGAIHAIASELYFMGNHSFKFNYAEFGGGLSPSDGSFMYFYLSNLTNIQLISNYAHQYGGAIWVKDVPFYTCYNENEPVRRCFYQYHCSPIDFNYIFDNNTAVLAGSSIYGGNLLNCYPYSALICPHDANSKQRLNRTLHSVSKSTNYNSSPISSDPIQVCLCTQYNEPDCSISHYTLEAFSGQQFPLTLVGVGQMNGTVPTVILSHTHPPGNSTVKTTGSKCSTLFYTISSDRPSVKLLLYPKSPCNNVSLHTLTISVNIKPCPPGFMLHNKTKSCTCDDTMRKLGIQCDINSQSFSHKHRVWIDYHQFNDHNETILYHPHCPTDFCMRDLINFSSRSNSHIQQEEDEHCGPQPQAPPQVSTTFIDLREPLLDS